MVGLIHVLLLNFVERNCGPGGIAAVLRRAGIPGGQVFRMDTVYDDEEFQRLLAAAIAEIGRPADEVEIAFARYSGQDLLLRFPGFWAGAQRARDMILRQPRIHNAMTGAARDTAVRLSINDKFKIEPTPDGAVIRYASPNRLCVFYRGLAGWVAEHFGEEMEVDEPACQRRGDEACEIHVRFRPAMGR
jgi:hypothetical protein